MPPQNNNNVAASALTGIAPSAMPSAYFQGAPLTKLGGMVWVLSQFVFKGSNTDKNRPSNTGGTTTGQAALAVMFLIPLLRKLERELGSAKFFLWTLTSLAFSMGLLQVLQIVLGDYYWQELFSDYNSDLSNFRLLVENNNYHPILVGAVLYWYVQYVPRLYPRFVTILGISLSEKALYGLWGLYVLLSGGSWSVATSLLGAISSAIILSTGNLVSIPEWLASNRTFESLGGLLLLDPPTKVYAPLMMVMRHNNNANNGGARGRNNAAAARPAPLRRPPPPPQAAIDQLTAMGFEESQVRQALQQSGNNVERAADRLLSG